jgi:DNA-directed RNA polymerase specialized sigma24 family protein
MHADTDYKRCLPWIKGFAYKVLRRVSSGGAHSVQLEDIVQELSIAWTIAQAKWNPELGVPFLAYLDRGMKLHINRWADAHVREAHVSLDAGGEDDDEGLGHTLIPDDRESQHDTLVQKQHLAKVLAKLSPRARQFVELLVDPPAELTAELKAIEAKRQFARERGVATQIITRINADLLFELTGTPAWERPKVMSEIRTVLAKVSQK